MADLDADRDNILWSRVRRDDTEAFGRLFDRHVDSVYRYAYAHTGDSSVAEEIVSIVFSEAWRQRGRIELLDESLRPWLVAVARNQCSRHHRRRLREQNLPIPPANRSEDHADRVVEMADASAELRDVLMAIDALSDGPRETLILRVWGELTHEQISIELGISIGTVKSRLSRARARLAAFRSGRRRLETVVDIFDRDQEGNTDV